MDISAFPTQSARTRRFTLGLPRDFTLSPDGRRVLFLRTRGPEDPTACLWLLEDDEERLLATDVAAYTTDPALSLVAYTVDGELSTLDLAPGSSPSRRTSAGSVDDPRIDPTGRRIAYVTGRSLRVIDLADGNDQLVASEDDPEVSWGVAEYIAAEEMHRTRGHWWSPDGTRLMAARSSSRTRGASSSSRSPTARSSPPTTRPGGRSASVGCSAWTASGWPASWRR
jgi:dipeptidyl-peptidase-4